MPKGTTASEAREAFEQSGSLRSDKYVRRTSGKGQVWQSRTASDVTEKSWAQGVTEAASKKRFSTNVAKAGAGRFEEGVRTKGALNWGTGMVAGSGRYQAAADRLASQVWNSELSTPRGAKRSPSGRQRMNENLDRLLKFAGRA